MTTLSETQTPTPRFGHLRAYLAGTGATGALVAGVIIVFLSLATFVAFKGMPFGGEGDNSGTRLVSVGESAPTAAAAALAAAPGAVAASPVPGAPIGAGAAGAVPGVTLVVGGGAGGGDGAGLPGSGGPGDGTVAPGTEVPPPGEIPGPGTEDPATPGAVGNVVNDVDRRLGTNLSGGPGGGVVDTVDRTATGTVNDVGGRVGKPGLGNTVNDRVNGVVNGLPGGR
jgi:hypothetical protein